MAIIANENKRPVTFNFKSNEIEAMTEDDELGSVKEIMEGKKTTEKATNHFRLNHQLLMKSRINK